MLRGKRGFSFVGKEVGLQCQICDSEIVSAERKFKIAYDYMYISMLPFLIIGFSRTTFISKETLMNVALAFFLSVSIQASLLTWKYFRIEFICDDESSDEYNDSSIHS